MRGFVLPIAAAAALGLAGCASNYGGEGALAGAALGAGVGAVAGGVSVAEGAAVGAAAGAVTGSLIRKNGRCYRLDRYGYERRVRCR